MNWRDRGEIEINGIQEGFRSPKQTPLVPPFLRAIRAEGGSAALHIEARYVGHDDRRSGLGLPDGHLRTG